MSVKSYYILKKVGKVLFIKWMLFDFLCVVCVGNEMKNFVFKEFLVCECVYLLFKEKKLLYMYFFMNI